MKQMNPKNLSETMASQQLKKMIPQLLLSVSLFSFVFSYKTLYSPSSSMIYSPNFHHYFSGNSFQLLTQALNKNCLFLICNALLVFLAKNSGFIRPPADNDLDDALQKRIVDSLQLALEKYVLEEVTREKREEDEEDESGSPKEEVSIFIAESEEEGSGGSGGDGDLEDREEENENQLALAESRKCWLFDEDDDNDDNYDEKQVYDEDEEEMSTEELNQKIEDFIRRMKADIIISEAREKTVRVK